ncbi:integrase catalytic domain-containing protein [Trichonephila inaurata madagascariensis]|uniref:Integrase catalytic domain-containing protein n=1 Tax=Trichonephila inaurata madagascariensis TaxID=2747483 RepID=A0A8X7BUX5_9ARAC|nr:integrase catalytic domain-containing protein [Trichonephila inaurata madagascariensis]
MLSVPKIQSEKPVQLRFLIDMVRSHFRFLKNIRMDSNVLSGAMLLHMLNSKIYIDRGSQRLFQLNLKTTEVPSLQDFFSFLETRWIQLESIRKTDFDTKKYPRIVLADEGFNQPSEISCLTASEHFFDIFGIKQIRFSNSNFRLINFKFGYVVKGSYIEELGYFKHCFLSKGWNTLDKTLRSFWETENISEEQPIITDELPYCEKHFEKTHFRKPCGKYSISLPFKENIQENVNLGDSRSIPSKELDRLW